MVLWLAFAVVHGESNVEGETRRQGLEAVTIAELNAKFERLSDRIEGLTVRFSGIKAFSAKPSVGCVCCSCSCCGALDVLVWIPLPGTTACSITYQISRMESVLTESVTVSYRQ